jgi:hypothetical protein
VIATLDARIVLRPMTPHDVPLLDHWDRQPHVIAATSDDLDQPKAFGEIYWPDELALVAPDYQYFIAELDGRPWSTPDHRSLHRVDALLGPDRAKCAP